MRISTWLRLIAVCLLAGSVTASASPVSAGAPASQPPAPLLKEKFTGYGPTVTDAEKDALQKACEQIEKQGGLGWTPNPQYLRDHNMVRFVGEPAEQDFEKLGRVMVVEMELEISKKQGQEIQKQAQVERMKSRQSISLLAVIGVVCLLAVVGGYLRLEEATKGYYTRLLRVAAVGVLIVIAAGLCLIA